MAAAAPDRRSRDVKSGAPAAGQQREAEREPGEIAHADAHGFSAVTQALAAAVDTRDRHRPPSLPPSGSSLPASPPVPA